MADLSESISGLFVECLNSFGSLMIALSNERCRVVHLEQVLPVQMFEEYGRFKIWGDQTKAELPALARGSLDDTLRRDAELRDLVHGILKRLRAVLSRATDIASRTIDPGAGSDYDSISSVSADSDSEDETATQSRRMPQICLLSQQITGQVRALHDLSSLLRRPNVTDKYIRSVQTKTRATGPLSDQVLDFSSSDLCHVQEKVLQWRGLTKSNREIHFDDEAVARVEGQLAQQQGIEDLSWFCHRLATANIRRREQLSYWDEHPYERDFSKPLIVVEAPVLGTRSEESRSQASTVKAPAQVLSVTSDWSETNTSKLSFSTAAISDLVDGGSITRPRTAYAPSIVEHSQCNTIPPPPKAEEGQPTFSCPYCGMSLDSVEMEDRQVWKRHVFRDLRPYVCTFESCQTAGKMYVSRHEWVYHEMQTHRREYVCKECNKTLPSRAEMTEHIHGHHEEPVKPGQLSVILDLCSRQIDTLDPRKEPCLICGQEMSLLELQSHLATHMESLAIFVLPSAVEDDGSKGSGASVRMANVEFAGERDNATSTRSSLGFSDGGEPSLTAVEFERLLLAAGTATTTLEIPGSDPRRVSATDLLQHGEGIIEEDFGYVTFEDLQRLDAQDMTPLELVVSENMNEPTQDQPTQPAPDQPAQDEPTQDQLKQEEPTQEAPTQPLSADELVGRISALISDGASPHVQDEAGRTPLHIACLGLDDRVVRLLLGWGANPNTQDRLGNTSLHNASREGHGNIVELLFQHNADPNIRNGDEQTSLHLSVLGGSSKVALTLFSHSADPNVQDLDGRTPLHDAVQQRREHIARLILHEHADANIQDNNGQTPLHLMALNRHGWTLGSSLISHSADPNLQDFDGHTPLHIASREGHDEVVRFLLRHGARTDLVSNHGRTPLHLAMSRHSPVVVELLLSNSADPKTQDHVGGTPLHYASRDGHLQIVGMLVRHIDSLKVADKDGVTALHLAAFHGHEEIVRYLLFHGAEVDCRDNDGRTPLHKACWQGHPDVLNRLLEYGDDVDSRDGEGRRPLHRASRRGHVLIVRQLLQKGADVESFDMHGWRALHEAADGGHAETINLLCLFGANVDRQTRLGRSPLLIAAWNGNTNVVRALLGKGADVNLADRSGWTPLMRAVSSEHYDTAATLLQLGALPGKLNGYGDTARSLARKTGNEALIDLLMEYSGSIPICVVPGCNERAIGNVDQPERNTCDEHLIASPPEKLQDVKDGLAGGGRFTRVLGRVSTVGETRDQDAQNTGNTMENLSRVSTAQGLSEGILPHAGEEAAATTPARTAGGRAGPDVTGDAQDDLVSLRNRLSLAWAKLAYDQLSELEYLRRLHRDEPHELDRRVRKAKEEHKRISDALEKETDAQRRAAMDGSSRGPATAASSSSAMTRGGNESATPTEGRGEDTGEGQRERGRPKAPDWTGEREDPREGRGRK